MTFRGVYQMDAAKPEVSKEQWVAPEIRTLDVGETHRFNLRGGDGGPYVDGTRS